MELFPAIDLRGGAAVRLTRGDFDQETRYGDPVALARTYIAGGARWIHVVDLEAARTGLPHELPVLEQILRVAAGRARVQTGGGIRSHDIVESRLHKPGLDRVVIGTAALKDPGLATRCAREWPDRVAVGLDYIVRPDGTAEAQGHGWLRGSEQSLPELLALWEGEPIAAVVATSIARDGMLEGPDVAGLGALLATTSIPVVASGGVATLDDLRALAALSVEGRRLHGVVVGKALVEGRFSVEEAVAACTASA